MIDYLEELLGTPEEKEEENTVPELGAVRTFRRHLWEAPAAGAAVLQTGRRGASDKAGSVGGVEVMGAGRRAGAADVLERALRQGDWLSAGAKERPGYAGGGKTWLTGQMWTPDVGAAPGNGTAVGSAAALEQRLARSVGRELSAARTVEVQARPESGPAWIGLEELDRRVERDARRYDGGLGLY